MYILIKDGFRINHKIQNKRIGTYLADYNEY